MKNLVLVSLFLVGGFVNAQAYAFEGSGADLLAPNPGPINTSQTPFQTLEGLYDQAGPAHITDIPTLAQAIVDQWRIKTVSGVTSSTKMADIKVDDKYLVRFSTNVVVKPGIPSAGPAFPGSPEVSEKLDLIFSANLKNEAGTYRKATDLNAAENEAGAFLRAEFLKFKITSGQRADSFRQSYEPANGSRINLDFRTANAVLYIKGTYLKDNVVKAVNYSYGWNEK